MDYLDHNLKNFDSRNDAVKQECQIYLKIIDMFFDELADINESEMHSIRNLALVDSSVNSGFSNNLLNAKRELMYNRYATDKDKDGNPKHYFMRGTELVFNKRFTPKDEIHDLKFWGKADRQGYYSEIERVYSEYTKTEDCKK